MFILYYPASVPLDSGCHGNHENDFSLVTIAIIAMWEKVEHSLHSTK